MTNKIKKISKKLLSITLCLVMLATTFFIFNPFTIKVHAATDYTVKSATNEYYYPAGSYFISYLAIGYSGKKAANAKSPLTDNRYTLIDYDMNSRASGDWVYVGYKTTQDISKAIRNVGVRISGSPPAELVSTMDNLTYYVVGNNGLGSNSVTDPSTDDADGVIDLNRGIDDAPYMYLYATRDIKAGPPIGSLATGNNIAAASAPNTIVKWLTTGSSNDKSVTAGDRADMNLGAGGDYIYINNMLPTGGTSVDSTAMRTAMNRAQTLISSNTDGRYVSTSALQTALNNAIPCYNALQAYAASTYNQAAIDGFTNAINSAINALQTEITLNPNGGTLDGSTNTKKVAYTVGGITSNIAFNVAHNIPYTVARNYYDFLGWSTSSTATTGNTNSVNISLTNRTLYAIWSPTLYTIGYNLNGGSVSTANPTSYNVETASFTLNNPTKTAYNFAGWTGSNGTTKQTTVTIAKGSNGNKTYTANYTPIQYTIGYTLNGGTATNPTSYNIETATFTLNNPTRTGYTFTGWTGSNGTTAQTSVSITKGSTGNKSYTANWNTVNYTIGYNLNGGTATNPTSYNIETPTFTLNNPTRTGYNFTGWTGSNGSTAQTSVSITKGNTGNKNYTANWATVPYTISYTLNGGTATNPGGYNIETTAFTLNNPTKTGYTFTGWTGSNGTTPQTTVSIAKGSTGNKSYTANWTANTYTVAYNGNGSTGGSTANSTHTYDTAKNLTTNGYTRTGYNFAGWAKTANGAVEYANSASVTNLTATNGATVTLYAKWTTEPYTITYNLNGGTATNKTTYDVETSAFTLNNPTKTGYTFTGWTGSNGTTPQTTVTIAQGSIGNRSYAANWKATPYSISYTLNGGTATNPTSYNIETATFTLNNPTRTGYNFTGWTGSNGSTAQTTVTIAKGSTGDKNYTANWNTVNYTIDYTLNGGTATNPASYNIETATFTLNTPTKTGYTFTGWTGSNGSTAQTSVSIAQGSIGNKTYTANYTANTYTVAYNGNGNTGGSTASSTHTYDTASNLTANGFTKTGFTFAGWATSANGAVEYANSASVKNLSTENGATVTLYAQWTKDTYRITYKLNGGSATNPTTYDVETADFTLNNPTRTGYTFTGWSGTEIDGTSMNVTIAQGSTGNREYTANWTGNTYTVTFDANSGTGTMAPQAFTYGTSQSLTANGFQKEGYYFAGWSTSPDGNVVYGDKKSVSNLTPEVNGEVTLYAVWKLTPEFEVAIPDYCGGVELSKHSDLNKYNVATVTAPMIKGGKYFVYWIATYNDGTTEIASTYRSYSFFVTRDVSLEPFYVATQSEYNTERAKALIVSRVTGFEANENGSSTLLVEHSVSPSAIGNQTGIIGHGVVYTANELYKNNLNIDIENDEVVDKIARTSKDNLTGLLEVNVGNATKVWAVPYVILKNGEVRYGTMKELNASQTFTVDEAMMTNSIMSFDLTSINTDGEELNIEETQPTVDEEFSQPTFIEKLIKIVTTIVENYIAIINKWGIIK